jgi:hypothetical protein
VAVTEEREWIVTALGEWHRSELRDWAGYWHSGQFSALYAYCSSGSVVTGLAAECRRAVWAAERDGLWEDWDALTALLTLAEAEELSEEEEL